MRWSLILLALLSETEIQLPIVVRDPTGKYCKELSPGVAQGVMLGRILQRDGGVVPLARIVAVGTARRADGGFRHSEPSVTTGGAGGEFFLPLPNGDLCNVGVSQSDFESRIVQTECSGRACVDVFLDPRRTSEH